VTSGGRTAIAAIVVAALFVAIAMVGKGGTELGRVVTVEIGLTFVAGAALVVAVLAGTASRLYGVGAALGFAALALFSGLSIKWSLAPDESWVEANRTLAYLFVFVAAVAAGNLLPGSLRALLAGITIASLAITGYALASRVWPESLGDLELYARLGQPFGYWNAVGVTAAMGLVGTTWFGARRGLRPWHAALAAPAGVLLITALFLTYSRSGLLAAVLALGLWLFAVPLRLRSLAVVTAGAIGAAPVIAWALSQDAFTEDRASVAVRADAGPAFGVLLLLAIALSYGLWLGALLWRERRSLTEAARRRAGRSVLVAGVCALLVVAGAMATTDRGLGGTLSDRLEELTDDSATTTGGPERLGTTASTRSRYWRAGIDVFEDHPLAGAGAGAFVVTNLRYRESANVSRHAHGYFVQTLADLGLAGLAISLIALGAWLFAALRSIGATPRSTVGQRFLLGDRRVKPELAPVWTDERIAVTALFLVALAYGLQAAADWTWFIPGPTVMGLVAAGYVAGRRPPRAPADPPDVVTPSRVGPWRVGVAVAILLATTVCSWNAWQPQRADKLANEAFALAADGEIDAAHRRAVEAREVNELSPKPLWAEAAVLTNAEHFAGAESVLEQAAAEHPNLADAWLRLADFRLDLGMTHEALEALEPALYLDPQSAAMQLSFIQIRDHLRAAGELPGETAPPAPPPQ
jgi:hypothetical protein